MEYFNNIDFRVVVHRHFSQVDSGDFKPSNHSIEFIRSGHVILHHNGEKIDLVAPVLFWMKEGDLYHFSHDPEEKKPCEHLYCDCSGEKADKMISFLEKHFPDGFFMPSDPEKVSCIFFDMVKYYRLGKEFYQPELSVSIDELMLQAVQTLRKESLLEDDPYHIRSLGDEIRKNPFEIFDFGRIAAKKGITLYHFRRLFHQIHFMSPGKFLQEQKMIRAAELLRLTNMRIKEIMFNCSFTSEMEFSRSFKRYSGLSPKKYRERAAENKNNKKGE